MEKKVCGSGKAWKTRGIFFSYFVASLSSYVMHLFNSVYYRCTAAAAAAAAAADDDDDAWCVV